MGVASGNCEDPALSFHSNKEAVRLALKASVTGTQHSKMRFHSVLWPDLPDGRSRILVSATLNFRVKETFV